MSVPYNFGQSQEDELIEASALKLTAGEHFLSIASAGDMPLSLAALGAGQVTAIDIDPAQLTLTRLKLTAVRQLPREEAIAFLGYLPLKKRRRRYLYHQFSATLPEADRAFWRSAAGAIGQGVIWAGRFERYLRYLRVIVVAVLGRRNVTALFECSNCEQQEHLFDESIGRPIIKRIFRFAFDPKRFSGKGMDPRSLAHRTSDTPLGDQYFSWFRSFCTSTLANKNHFLQLTMLGRVLNNDAVPAYLSADGYAALRAREDSVVLIQGDICRYLNEIPAGTLNKAHLSNICDWMDQDSFEQVMRALVEAAVPEGRVVWRYLHVNRTLPADLRNRIEQECDLGQALRGRDRYPFYTIVPAQFRA